MSFDFKFESSLLENGSHSFPWLDLREFSHKSAVGFLNSRETWERTLYGASALSFSLLRIHIRWRVKTFCSIF